MEKLPVELSASAYNLTGKTNTDMICSTIYDDIINGEYGEDKTVQMKTSDGRHIASLTGNARYSLAGLLQRFFSPLQVPTRSYSDTGTFFRSFATHFEIVITSLLIFNRRAKPIHRFNAF